MKYRAYEIAINLKYNDDQRELASMLHKLLYKKKGFGESVNEEAAQELHKPVVKSLKRIKVYVRFKDNIWATDFDEIASQFSKIQSVKYLSCVRDLFTNYPWVKPLNDKKTLTKIVNESNRKPNK